MEVIKMKYKKTGDLNILLSDCPYDIDVHGYIGCHFKSGKPRVGGIFCTHSCIYFRGINRRLQNVKCMKEKQEVLKKWQELTDENNIEV